MKNKKLIDQAVSLCLDGHQLDRNTIIQLLDMDTESDDVTYLRQRANYVGHVITEDQAFLWGSMGIDYKICEMNCKFCTFGREWDIVKEEKFYSDQEILAQMKDYVDDQVHYIVIRTTEFFSIDELAEKVKKLKSQIPGSYELILNIGEFDYEMACKLHQAGVDGVYHALRLREGQDTDFDPADRMATLNAIKKSPLKLISLVEPVGIEHTSEELADNFINIRECGAIISGVMARVPVKGTPLGDKYQMISEERLAHLTAVLRLAAGRQIPHICVHPPSEAVTASGANVAVVETGAVPREADPVKDQWQMYTAQKAIHTFSQAQYQVQP